VHVVLQELIVSQQVKKKNKSLLLNNPNIHTVSTRAHHWVIHEPLPPTQEECGPNECSSQWLFTNISSEVL